MSMTLHPNATQENGELSILSPSVNSRMVIVVRADPVICGHSVEARNLAEVARLRGFDEVRILSWPIDRLAEAGLPLKPLDTVPDYSPGIIVERPEPVGDYKVPDGRYLAGLTGRLIELFSDGTPTVCMSLYLSPHDRAVVDARRLTEAAGLPCRVTTIAEAVGSDITNVVRSCVAEGRFGAAVDILATYLANDHCVAVSEYTKELIVSSATELDARAGTRFAPQLADRVEISYPAIDSTPYVQQSREEITAVLERRGLTADGYVLFLSRLALAKGVDDLIEGFANCKAGVDKQLVIAGNGPDKDYFKSVAEGSGVADRIVFFDDVDDVEKPALMAGCAAYVLPSKPRPEFTETFGIALVEKMLAGGGPVITALTGGIGEAVGDTAMIIEAGDAESITRELDKAMELTPMQREAMAIAARAYGLQFDRQLVFERLLGRLPLAA
ncbi:glycosyltransferase [Naumannella halotolerans]|uniref:Glycosyl transferase family 1 n=1 Tax=Naumannella halotolerans TaxID=993414 RepID=A0A4R7J7N6_9ACTN|nr:glycosyltransferase [Naumannella halotolerans]TDT32473.1 glycosyl transferase family 1 [Naumannella halotolerans]